MPKQEDELLDLRNEYRALNEKLKGLTEEELKLVTGGAGSSAIFESDPSYLLFKSDIDYLYRLIVAAPASSPRRLYSKEDLEAQCRYLQIAFSPDAEILRSAYDFLSEAEGILRDLYGSDWANENKLTLLFGRMRKNAEIVIASL